MTGPIHNPQCDMPDDTPKCLNEPKIQLNIKESFELPWPVNDARAKELHYSIAEMIAVDNQPMSIVEDSGFARLMNKMKPRYKLPSRKYLADVIIIFNCSYFYYLCSRIKLII